PLPPSHPPPHTPTPPTRRSSDLPHGHTVTNPAAAGFVTVTFITTARASPGTPATPPACNCSVPLAATDAPPVPLRVSRIRLGLSDRKSTRLNSSHLGISYAVFCL